MTECLAYNPQNNFASVIENINRELREKGELIFSLNFIYLFIYLFINLFIYSVDSTILTWRMLSVLEWLIIIKKKDNKRPPQKPKTK